MRKGEGGADSQEGMRVGLCFPFGVEGMYDGLNVQAASILSFSFRDYLHDLKTRNPPSQP